MSDKIIPLTYNGKVIGEVNIFNNVDSDVISEIFGDIIITTEEGREIINKFSQNTIGISARKFNPNSDNPTNQNNFMEFSIITS
ncbi:MAG: hypothetical protein WC996_09840 [Peptostreptococcales bacterium]